MSGPRQRLRLTSAEDDGGGEPGILNEVVLQLVFARMKWDLATVCAAARVNRKLRAVAKRILWRQLCMFRAPRMVSALSAGLPGSRIAGGWHALAKLLFFCPGSNSGPGQAGSGCGYAGSGRLGPGNTGSAQAGSGSMGSGQSGPGGMGRCQARNGGAGSASVGSDSMGSGQAGAGDVVLGEARPGVVTGSCRVGQDFTWPGHMGPSSVGPGHAGPSYVGSGQSGPCNMGPGDIGSGQSRSGSTGMGHVGPVSMGSGQGGSGHVGQCYMGPGQSGSGNAGSSYVGSDQSGPGNGGSSYVGPGQSERNHVGSGQFGQGNTVSGQAGLAVPGHFVKESRFSKTSGRSFLTRQCRGDLLYVSDPCEHALAGGPHRDEELGVYRGVFRGFMRSRTRAALIGRQAPLEERARCPYCGARLWNMTAAGMVPKSAARRLGTYDGGLEYFICINGHLHGTCWLVPLSSDEDERGAHHDDEEEENDEEDDDHDHDDDDDDDNQDGLTLNNGGGLCETSSLASDDVYCH